MKLSHYCACWFTRVKMFCQQNNNKQGVQYNAKNTSFETKTTNTGKTGAEFELVTGSPYAYYNNLVKI